MIDWVQGLKRRQKGVDQAQRKHVVDFCVMPGSITLLEFYLCMVQLYATGYNDSHSVIPSVRVP